MNLHFGHRSLSSRVFVALIVGETVFAALLGLTIGAFAAFSSAHQRETAIRQVSATIAAGLMPTVAQQEVPRVRAQLESILSGPGSKDLTGVEVLDSSGTSISRRGRVSGRGFETSGTPVVAPLSLLTENQVIEQPIVVDGLRVAAVRVAFAPPGLASLALPLTASGLVLLAVLLVSVPWTAWALTREVVEPLEDLGDYASSVAQGDFEASFRGSAYGEIGELQATMSSMVEQLKSRDRQLDGAFVELADAYEAAERSREEIEQLSAVKSNFVAIAAHEIRSPLSVISLYAELLLAGELGHLDEAPFDAVLAISSASSRLASIVSDLMDAALLERGLLPIHLGTVDLPCLLDAVLQDARLLGQGRGIAIALKEPVPRVVFRGDTLRLHQVMNNLLSNAIKYSPEDTEVQVSGALDDDCVVIEVADRGKGIPDESRGQLFALFGRLDVGDSRETAGLGLGLAITARIVEAHGGTITHRANEQGQGSVFSVRLPMGGPHDPTLERVTIAVTDGGGER